MAEMVGSNHAVDTGSSHESPLVPNKVLQSMYEGIVESRMLEGFLQSRSGKLKGTASPGDEACRVSALIDLTPDDLSSDLADVYTAAFLRGGDLPELLLYIDSGLSKKHSQAALPGILPQNDDVAERFALALGAALAIKRLKLPHVVVVFSVLGEAKASTWKKTLRIAALEELPVFFVVLPDPSAKSGKKTAKMISDLEHSGRKGSAGVPCIPVDASDAVALYRVAQESIGRARVGGGPALMECTHFLTEDQKKPDHADPAVMMAETLLRKRICGQDWLDDVTSGFENRLAEL